MKKMILALGLLLSLSAQAADDSQVGRGIQQVERARRQLESFLRDLPLPLRGYAAKVSNALNKCFK